MKESEKIAIGGGVAAGLAAVVYYMTRPAAAAVAPTSTAPTASSSASSPSGYGALPYILQSGAQTIPLSNSGTTIALPTGAVWVTDVGTGTPSFVGTSNPLVLPGPNPAAQGATETVPVQWSLNGQTYTTTLTLTAPASIPGGVSGVAGIGMLGAAVFNPSSSLRGGQQLAVNQSLYSPQGLYRAVMQSDGNLVVYTNKRINFWLPGTVIWAAGTNNSCAIKAVMQTDGNFVLYKTKISMAPQYAVYSSNTQGHPGSWITMQDDGNLVVYSAAGQALWASKSQPKPWYYYGNNDCSMYRNL